VPFDRRDRRLLVVTGAALVLAAVLFTGVLLLATGTDSSTKREPVFLGTADQLTKEIRGVSPRYYADPFGGDGFWLDVHDGTLVAYVLNLPGHRDCAVKWREQHNAYVASCTNQAVPVAQLAQYPVLTGSRDGSPGNAVYVDLRRTIAPGTTASTSTPPST